MYPVKEYEFSEFLNKCRKLFDAHQKEVPDIPISNDQLDLNLDLYKAMWDNGNLILMGAEADGEFIGYLISTISPSLHNKNRVLVDTDVLYVKPKYRGSSLASELIQKTEETARQAGAHAMTVTMKHYYRFDKLLYMLGYDDHEVKKIKVLN